MKHYYALKDNKANEFIEMIPGSNDASAIRNIQVLVNRDDPKNNLFNYPQEFDLYHMCSMNELTGEVVQVKVDPNGVQEEKKLPLLIVNCDSLKKKDK